MGKLFLVDLQRKQINQTSAIFNRGRRKSISADPESSFRVEVCEKMRFLSDVEMHVKNGTSTWLIFKELFTPMKVPLERSSNASNVGIFKNRRNEQRYFVAF